jgi:multidrug efflux pump subunit AcrB
MSPTENGPEELNGGPISWMARNPVAANLLMVALIVGGLLMAGRVKKEVFPQIALDRISVTVPYPGASPAEVEQGILLAVEEAVRPLDDVKEVTSVALESFGTVNIELEKDANHSKALSDVKNAIDRITSFPVESERPIVNLPEWRAEAISLVVYSDQDEKVMHALGERVRDELLQMPDVSYVELAGVRPLEISIEVPHDLLRTYGLTLPHIAQVVRRTAIELPAGGVKTAGGEVLLRTTERRDLGAEFADIPIMTGSDGSPLKLGDIAQINDGFAETDTSAAFEGKPSVLLQVYSVGNQSPTEVAKAVKRYADELKPTLPPGIFVTTWNDRSKLYDERLDLLLRNAMLGLAMVLLILGLFLETKLAFWVTMGIPISFLGSLILLPALDVSLNMISLFAFIVTLGMVVDDAIVVGENAFRMRRQGIPFLKAAILGAKQVATPVFFSIATTVAAFSPLLMIPGTRGKWMISIPIVVILVLIISLIESFFILPAHIGHLSETKKDGLFYHFSRLQGKFSRGVEGFIDNYYRPLVAATTRQRWVTVAVAITVFTITLGLISSGRVKFIDFPKEESDWVIAEARLPFGSAVKETEKVMQQLVATAQEVIEENGGQKISTGIFSMLGVSFTRRGGRASGGHVTSVAVTLVPTDQRQIGAGVFADKWRERLGSIAGLESLAFNSSTGHGSSKPIDIELSHSNIPVLEAAARDLADKLATFGGVKDIENGIELGKPQLDFKMSDEGIAAGLTSVDLAAQVRSAFYGAEAFRQQRGRHEMKVMVRLPQAERETLHSVEELMIRTPTGGEMPLRAAAGVVHGRAYTSINRTDGKRTLRVQADVEEGKANPREIMMAVFKDADKDLKAKYPGLQLGSAGRQKEMGEFFDFLIVGYIMALIAMYGLIAVPLKSYLQPFFVVMMAIPFGLVGAVLGHVLMGMQLSMISLMGMVALSGVVVNDSIVYVDAANRYRKQGLSPIEAGLAAARQRFRPIILTSLTTFVGLAPMIFETSLQARILIPMAVSLGFGVMFATMVILVLVPSLFVIIENIRNRNVIRKQHDYKVDPLASGEVS